jgi:hypothetical protein
MAMSRFDYEALLRDWEWLKRNHPERKTLIEFVERFQTFVTEEHTKMRENELVTSGASDVRHSS